MIKIPSTCYNMHVHRKKAGEGLTDPCKKKLARFIFELEWYKPGLPDFFKPKIPIWVNIGGSCNGRCWYIIWPFGLCIIRLNGL
jgi:hypothetical protein